MSIITSKRPIKYRTFSQQNTPRELETFQKVFACSVAFPVPATADPYPSSIPLVKAFERTVAIDAEIPVTMRYERTGKSRLFTAYLRGCLSNLLGRYGRRIHKSGQPK